MILDHVREGDHATATDDATLLVVNEALDRLDAQDSMKASLVKIRFFVGVTAEESAPVLGVSVPTVGSIRLTDAQGNPVRGIRVSLDPDAQVAP